MDARRSIPSVERLLSSDAFAPLLRQWPRALVMSAIRADLDDVRAAVARGETSAPHRPAGHGIAGPAPGGSAAPDRLPTEPDAIAVRVAAAIDAMAEPTLRPVINATGVVLHTNLGRAPLADAALNAIAAVARGYTNVEYDVATGARGSRYTHCRTLLCTLTGAADALVVNNNAAALVLALNTVSRGFDTIVSRGELVEIGGAFRVPEIIARSGARLKEVGATNRTHADDYAAAVDAGTGALLKVHPSNFSVSGFTAEASLPELGEIAADAGVPLIHDVGSGLLVEPASVGLTADEPTPGQSLQTGAAVVTLSGDKLLGGPQCGIILGRSDLLDRMRRNPMCRALRVDKLTIAALAATLRLYLEPARALREIPVLRMLALDVESIRARASALAAQCCSAGMAAEVEGGTSAVGGGAAASVSLPTALVVFTDGPEAASRLERRLRAGRPPVIARMVDGRVAIDLRTVAPHEDAALLRALHEASAA